MKIKMFKEIGDLSSIMKGFIFFILIQSVFFTHAEVSVDSELRYSQIYYGEKNVMTLIVQGAKDIQPEIPTLEDVEIYSAGTSQSISIINGVTTSSLRLSYVLVPKKEGKIKIPPITISHMNHDYQTNALEFDVLAPRSSAQANSLDREKDPAAISEDEEKQSDLFVEMKVDQNECFVQQPLKLSFLFYRKPSVNLLSQPNYAAPDMTGFWVEGLPDEKNYYTKVNGVQYLVSEVSSLIYPTQSGEFSIGRGLLKCSIRSSKQSRSRDPFDMFFNDDPFGSFRGKEIILKTDPIQLTVKPIPQEGQPVNFSGVVGQYSIDSRLSQLKVKQGDPFTFKIILTGKGNLSSIPDIEIPSIDGVRVIDSSSQSDSSNQNNSIQGEKIWEKILIPSNVGELKIPEIKFSYFDPWLGEFKIIQTSSHRVQVIQNESINNEVVEDFTSQSSDSNNHESNSPRNQIPESFAYIKQDLNGTMRESLLRKQRIIMMGIKGMPLLFVFILIIHYGLQLKLKNETQTKIIYKDTVKNIKKLLNETIDPSEKLKRVDQLMMRYITVRFNFEWVESLKEIENQLESHISNPELVKEFIRFIEESRFIVYSAYQENQEINALIQKALQIINQMEGAIK